MQKPWVRRLPMEAYPWQLRAKAAGLTQRKLSKLLGHHERTISMQLRDRWQSGVPTHVIAAILAWEMMTPAMREAWERAIEREQPERASAKMQSEVVTVSAAEFQALKKQLAELTKRQGVLKTPSRKKT